MKEESLESTISSLPPEILRRIVSLIPLKEAVRATILSTTWKSLWTPFRVESNFNSNQILGLLLKSCDYPELWKFRLVGFHDNKEDLIFSAAKGAGKELHLDFSGGEKQTIAANFNLILEPSCESSCKFSADQMTKFSSLRTLNLISVNGLAGDLVSALFFNCRLLESLNLEKCTGIQNINVKSSNSLKAFAMADCPNTASIAISAPNLESFQYRGALPLIQIKSSPKLADVTLDLRKGFENNEFDCEDGLDLLTSLKDVEILTISGWFLEWLCEAGVIFDRLQFRFNKLKELYWFDSLMNKTKRDSLACFLNISAFLEKLFIKIDKTLSCITCPHFRKYWNEAHLWMIDYEIEKSITSQHEHLKMVQVTGFTIQENHLLLMDLLLKKSGNTLNSMTVITSPENRRRRVSKIPKTQLKHTSGSDVKRIVVPSPNEDHFFALTEEEEEGKHFLGVWSLL